jgi:hypothetical protein
MSTLALLFPWSINKPTHEVVVAAHDAGRDALSMLIPEAALSLAKVGFST